MKEIFKNTLQKLDENPKIEYIDRDRGQLENYGERPAVKFPCALIKVNFPKRENLNPSIQKVSVTVQIRIAFERLIDQHNLNDEIRLNKALEYYDIIEEIETQFQGLKLGKTDRWECSSTIDEDRKDLDIVKMTFKTGFMIEF